MLHRHRAVPGHGRRQPLDGSDAAIFIFNDDTDSEEEVMGIAVREMHRPAHLGGELVSNSPRLIWTTVLFCTAAALFLRPAAATSWDFIQLNAPQPSPVTLKFRSSDPAHKLIDEGWLLQRLVEALQARSHWPLRSDNQPIADLSGLRTRLDQPQSRIVFQYVHVDHNQESVEWGQTLTLPVAYEIERANDDITVRLLPPEQAEFATRKNPALIFSTPKLWPAEKVFADFAAIMEVAQSLKLRSEIHITGEENSTFKPDSCLANFERLLGRDAHGAVSADRVFSYRAGKMIVPLKIAALPYRDGTKVLYEASLPFELGADGTGDGYDLPATLQSDIRRILND
jgi:hypothetical protein